MLELKSFVAECRAQLPREDAQTAIAKILESVVRRPTEVDAVLGPPVETKLRVIERSPDLTILQVCFAPGASFYPHNHNVWSIVAVYQGVEENEYFVREHDTLRSVRHANVEAGTVVMNDPSVIHAVANRGEVPLGAIHVYGGDFFTTPRSEWDPQQRVERPYDLEKAMRALGGTAPK